jgi:hypothetical protein
MPLVTCTSCKRRMPQSARSCPHCGELAPKCVECLGTGECPKCEKGRTAAHLPCSWCLGSGQCPTCGGNKVKWPATG